MLTSIMSMSELCENGVLEIKNIALQRKKQKNFQAVYFIEPTENNVIFMSKDDKLYKALNLFFTKEIPPNLIKLVKEKKGLLRKITNFSELNFDLDFVNDFLFRTP